MQRQSKSMEQPPPPQVNEDEPPAPATTPNDRPQYPRSSLHPQPAVQMKPPTLYTTPTQSTSHPSCNRKTPDNQHPFPPMSTPELHKSAASYPWTTSAPSAQPVSTASPHSSYSGTSPAKQCSLTRSKRPQAETVPQLRHLLLPRPRTHAPYPQNRLFLDLHIQSIRDLLHEQ